MKRTNPVPIINIFYSWQSDLDPKLTRYYFKNAIEAARQKIEEEGSEHSLVLHEATSNLPGSPEIVSTILQKISNCHVFICDVSLSKYGEKGKFSPNPNVLLELGYAIKCIGWERIILLFNSHFGDIKALPFDIPDRRVTSIDIVDPKAKDVLSRFNSIIYNAIKIILDKNPVIPSDRDMSYEDEHDLEFAREFVEYIPPVVFKRFIERAPDYLSQDIISRFDGYEDHVAIADFHIFDSNISTLFYDFMKKMKPYFNPSLYYSHDPNSGEYKAMHQTVYGNIIPKNHEEIERLRQESESLYRSYFSLISVLKLKYKGRLFPVNGGVKSDK